ncbi:hypothetical protein [Deinococcus sp. LM3]|uniref:hypothetical protein n=1 Tax=Deinococcus sp. LM3 TaxID=1938608 RepID=UPI001F0ABEDA|nr:hypothetical protein [Deinococcus sp. LM3]
MVKLDETPLPGVGMRYDFDSRSGKRVGVITHRDGRREIFVARRDDPDACAESIVLADDEAEAVADLLGGSAVTRRLETSMQDIQDSPWTGYRCPTPAPSWESCWAAP